MVVIVDILLSDCLYTWDLLGNTLGSRDLNNTTQTEQSTAPPPLTRQKSNKKKPYVKANFAVSVDLLTYLVLSACSLAFKSFWKVSF